MLKHITHRETWKLNLIIALKNIQGTRINKIPNNWSSDKMKCLYILSVAILNK